MNLSEESLAWKMGTAQKEDCRLQESQKIYPQMP